MGIFNKTKRTCGAKEVQSLGSTNEAQVNVNLINQKVLPRLHPPPLAANIIILSFQELYFYFKNKSNIVYLILIQRTEVLVSQHS